MCYSGAVKISILFQISNADQMQNIPFLFLEASEMEGIGQHADWPQTENTVL